MAAVDLLAGTVMAKAASLMNDTARTVYTYAAQVPYLQLALQELREYYELHNIPSTQEVSAVINMPAGTSKIVFNGVGIPTLPNDFVEPQQVWEREAGIDPWIPMTRKSFLPHQLEGTQVGQFMYYTWQANEIRVFPANRNNDIKLDYTKELFSPVVDETSIINVITASTFLEYRTAALLAEFIERNKPSADGLNTYAILALDRATGIGIRSKQTIMTRRRPFRAAYKRRGY